MHHVVMSIISDVPLASVGLMAFGIFTFLTAMRRASLSHAVLFAASFLMFGAAIIDLSKTVAEVENAVVGGVVHQLNAVRDVGLACSVGLIYLFMWSFVAERPQVESQMDLPRSQIQVQHSGTWCRWGLPGELLKWLSLTLCFLTTLFRIFWHLLTSRVRGPLLITNAILEVVLSAIFILKPILNISLVHVTLRWKSLRDYIVPIIAMVISAALAVGNLATTSSPFTDTTAGRLLLSIELYILLLFALINSFYEDIKSITATLVDREQDRNEKNRDIPEVHGQGRRSMVASTWIGPQRMRSVDWRDLGLFRNIRNRVSGQSMAIHKAAAIPEGASPLQSRGLNISPVSALDEYDWSPVGSKPLPDLPDDVEGFRPSSSFSLHSTDDSSLSTFAKISRQREALEQTFSKLKSLHHVSMDTNKPSTVEDTSSAQSTSDAIRSPTSACTSDFSLSRFPEPPPPTIQSPSPQSLAARRKVRKSRRKATYFQSMTSTTLENKNSRDLLAIPDDVPSEHESAVWQYDVTSFIDDLTTPAPSAMYNGSDFTWRGVESNDFSTAIVAGDEQESPSTTLSRLHTIDTPGEHALTKHDLGSMQSGAGPTNGGNVNKTGMKVRPRPPPIRVPGA